MDSGFVCSCFQILGRLARDLLKGFPNFPLQSTQRKRLPNSSFYPFGVSFVA